MAKNITMAKQCNIQYIALDDNWRKEQKLQWFTENPLKEIPFEHIQPDKNNNWINIADNDFETLLPLCSKDVKAGKSKKALFELLSNGIVTARDEWSYGFSKKELVNKVKFFCNYYREEQKRWSTSNKKVAINDFVNRGIKFGSEIEAHLVKGDELIFDETKIISSHFRPFISKPFYFDRIYTHRIYQQENFFGLANPFENKVIAFLSIASSHPLYCLCTNKIFDAGLLKQGNGLTTSVSLYRYDKEGNQFENITDWGLQQFTKQYGKKVITKEAIFHYVYAVLHYPAYRQKYELNLKREFPRIPFYNDFKQWSDWGKQLMDLHINYETVKPFELNQIEAEYEVTNPSVWEKLNKPKLKANKVLGEIEIDGFTTLAGIPKQAWEYKLGNRSALDWVLDQYKESKPKDSTIAEKFNTYKFADYKDQVLDLLKKVCTVSVETMKIVGEMEKINE